MSNLTNSSIGNPTNYTPGTTGIPAFLNFTNSSHIAGQQRLIDLRKLGPSLVSNMSKGFGAIAKSAYKAAQSAYVNAGYLINGRIGQQDNREKKKLSVRQLKSELYTQRSEASETESNKATRGKLSARLVNSESDTQQQGTNTQKYGNKKKEDTPSIKGTNSRNQEHVLPGKDHKSGKHATKASLHSPKKKPKNIAKNIFIATFLPSIALACMCYFINDFVNIVR